MEPSWVGRRSVPATHDGSMKRQGAQRIEGVGTEDPNWDRPWYQRARRLEAWSDRWFGWLRGPWIP